MRTTYSRDLFFLSLLIAALAPFRLLHADTLYGVNQYGAVYDLNNIVNGTTTIGSLVRPSIPGTIQGEVVGTVRSIEYVNNSFIVGAQQLSVNTNRKGKLFQFGIAQGGEQFIGKIGVGTTYYYSPLALAKNAQGDLYMSFSTTAADRADTIGKVNPANAQIDQSTIKTANPSTVAYHMDGMAFDSSGALFAASTNYPASNPGTAFFNFSLTNGAITPYCSGSACWSTPGGATAVAINQSTNVKMVARNIGGGNTEFYRLDLTTSPYTTTLVYLGKIEAVWIVGLTYSADVVPPFPPSRECDYKVINGVTVCL